MLAHSEHFLAGNITLERARTAAHAPEQGHGQGQGSRHCAQCAAHTGIPEEHHCSEVRGWITVTHKGTLYCLQFCWELQCQDRDIHDLSQLHSPRGGQIPEV